MTTNNFILFFLFACISMHAQIKFEKGYIIDNTGQRTDCWIKNVDWRQNPSEFEYRLTNDGPTQTGSLQNIAEFSILNDQKYFRAKVNIEVSPSLTKELSKTKEPLFEEKTSFLKVLVDGKATLYEYNKSGIVNYLFRVDNDPITTLIFKKYLLSTFNISENTTYRKQLWDKLKCSDIPLKDFSQLQFKKNELISLFVKYHLCDGSEYTTVKKKSTKESIKLAIKGGISSSKANIRFGSQPQDIDFPNQISPRIGIEAEYIFPFNQNKWSFFVQSMYQSYNSDGIAISSSRGSNIDYKSIENTLGIRHYSFLSNTSKLFVNAGLILDVPLGSEINFEFRPNLKIQTPESFNLGLGYIFKDTYSVEINYTPNRKLIKNFAGITSNYTNFSLVFGYQFL